VSDIVVVVGYSYSDPHINYLLKEAYRRNVRIYNVTLRNVTPEILKNGYMNNNFGVILKNNYPDIYNWSKDVAYFYSEYIRGFDNFLSDEEWLNI